MRFPGAVPQDRHWNLVSINDEDETKESVLPVAFDPAVIDFSTSDFSLSQSRLSRLHLTEEVVYWQIAIDILVQRETHPSARLR